MKKCGIETTILGLIISYSGTLKASALLREQMQLSLYSKKDVKP